jgi:hypothetical protein
VRKVVSSVPGTSFRKANINIHISIGIKTVFYDSTTGYADVVGYVPADEIIQTILSSGHAQEAKLVSAQGTAPNRPFLF